ncbi:MAG TPA: hypothetical protein VKP30_25045 [Polyangiaceae bacterium]|nr:hypothetical protein [Polyangiaceae bacterium]
MERGVDGSMAELQRLPAGRPNQTALVQCAAPPAWLHVIEPICAAFELTRMRRVDPGGEGVAR